MACPTLLEALMRSGIRVKFIALITMVILATGCNLEISPAASPTPNLNALSTSAAATTFVQLTSAAAQIPSTATQPPVTQPPAQTTAPTAGTTSLTPVIPVETQAIATSPTTSSSPTALLPGTVIPSLTPISISSASGGNANPGCLRSIFIADITVPDGTVFKGGDRFEKIWRMENTGTCTWDEGFSFNIWAGPAMGASAYIIPKNNKDKFILPGWVVDIGIDMKAPYQSGQYISHWSWFDDAGHQFGGDFVVDITVK